MTITDLAASVYYPLNTHLIGSRNYIVCVVELYVHENADLTMQPVGLPSVKIMEYSVCLGNVMFYVTL